MGDLESATSDVELTKPVQNTRRKMLQAVFIVLSIPLAVIIAGVVTTWWRPATLHMVVAAMKVMGYSKLAEPMAVRAVELCAHADGLNSKPTMNALWNLGQVYIDNGKTAKAEQVFRTITAYNSKHPHDGAVAPYQVLRAWSKTLRTLGKTKDADRIEAQLECTTTKEKDRP